MLIIDVRTPEEYAQGHLEGAILIEYQYILRDIARYIDSIDDPIGLYCAAGIRSGIAHHLLKEHGFTKTQNLGGYLSLKEQFPFIEPA